MIFFRRKGNEEDKEDIENSKLEVLNKANELINFLCRYLNLNKFEILSFIKILNLSSRYYDDTYFTIDNKFTVYIKAERPVFKKDKVIQIEIEEKDENSFRRIGFKINDWFRNEYAKFEALKNELTNVIEELEYRINEVKSCISEDKYNQFTKLIGKLKEFLTYFEKIT